MVYKQEQIINVWSNARKRCIDINSNTDVFAHKVLKFSKCLIIWKRSIPAIAIVSIDKSIKNAVITTHLPISKQLFWYKIVVSEFWTNKLINIFDTLTIKKFTLAISNLLCHDQDVYDQYICNFNCMKTTRKISNNLLMSYSFYKRIYFTNRFLKRIKTHFVY